MFGANNSRCSNNANSEITKQLTKLSFLDVKYAFEVFDENSYLLVEKTTFVHSVMINDIEKFIILNDSYIYIFRCHIFLISIALFTIINILSLHYSMSQFSKRH